MKRAIAAFILIISLVVSAGSVLATPPANLPDVRLAGLNGESLNPSEFGKGRGVVVLFVRKGTPGGDILLDLMEGLERPLPAGRLIVVLSRGDENLLKLYAKRYHRLAASWCLDSGEKIAKEMKVQSTPLTMGVVNARVAWTLAGVPDAEMLEKSVRGWLNR